MDVEAKPEIGSRKPESLNLVATALGCRSGSRNGFRTLWGCHITPPSKFFQNSATLRPALRVPVRVLLPARRRCAPEFWFRSAIRPYPGFRFAWIRHSRAPSAFRFLHPSAPLRLCAKSHFLPFAGIFTPTGLRFAQSVPLRGARTSFSSQTQHLGIRCADWWRRGWDSNPRDLAVLRFSRPAH